MATWLITGTSSGLGRALAEQVLTAGHQLVATARDPRSVEDLRDAHPDRVLALPLDVTDSNAVTEVVRQAEAHFGAIDVLVNNAATGTSRPSKKERTMASSRCSRPTSSAPWG